MKKIKLLTPILGLTTVTSGMLPLVCCHNKSDAVEVTEAEWKSAIGYLCGYSEEPIYWSFSKDDYIGVLTSSEENATQEATWYHDWITTPYGVKGIETKKDLDTGVSKDENWLELVAGQMVYRKTTDSEGSNPKYAILTNSYFELVGRFLATIYNYYNDFVYSDGYYTYSGKFEEMVTLNTKIGFNSDKKMASLETTFAITLGSASATVGANIHANYEHKEIEVSQDLLDRYNRHVFTVTNDVPTNADLTCFGAETEQGILDIKTTEKGCKKLYCRDKASGELIYPSCWMNPYTIIKNGEDFTEYTKPEDAYIEFNEPLTKDDRLTIRFCPDSAEYNIPVVFTIE